ncbi:ATP-binding protein [Cupriavidus sp. 2KB_3]|uniref:sensor histidine kinase n=1 Tax=Cupriavidus sp. 2KB_3 TaxID=3232980 RepID=UPI003F91A97A
MSQPSGDIQSAMVRLLYRQSHGVLFANFVIPVAVVFVLRHSTYAGPLLWWMAMVYAVTLARILLSMVFYRYESSATPRAWANRFAAMSWVSAALWGWLGSTALFPPGAEWTAFACIVLAGMTCGAVPALSAQPRIYVGMVLLMGGPFIVHNAMQPEPIYNVYAAFGIAMIVVNSYFSRVTYHTLLTGVKLRFENLALIGQLEHERDRATAADMAKTRFLAAASHDLRQPVHALGLLSASLAAVAECGDVRADAASQISQRLNGTLDRMGGLLDGLLHVSRLDAGLMPARRQPLSLGKLLADLRDEYAEQASQHGSTLRVRVTQAWIDSDPELLRRILDNLLSNALRYAPQSRIVVGARRRPGAIEIQVLDSGPGIDPSQQALVFEEFTQLPNVQSEHGLGLGLAIVRRLADLLGHPVTLRSTPGRGSNFSVTVPLARDAEPEASALTSAEGLAPADLQARYGVMLVDDDPQILAALGDLLAFWGHTVYAGATVEAVCAAHQRARIVGPAPVDLILADFRLAAQVTGRQAIAWLREYLDTEVPGLIVTGDTAPDRLKALHASGLRVLHKPIAAPLLRQAIVETVRGGVTVESAHAG